MPGKAFLDSNILTHAVGQDDARRAVADALIVQDAVVSAQVLYSEDMHDGQLIDGTLTIINPFAA